MSVHYHTWNYNPRAVEDCVDVEHVDRVVVVVAEVLVVEVVVFQVWVHVI